MPVSDGVGATALTRIESSIATCWQAVVIGGGPSGLVAAKLLKDAGLRTLLVEAKRFPRDKVCGGCLNERAVTALKRAGFGEALQKCRGVATNGVVLHAAGRSLAVATPPGVAVTRGTLDSALLKAAVCAGVETRLGTRAFVLPATTEDFRRVRLSDESGSTSEIQAGVVIAADGLGSPSLARLRDFTSRTAKGSHLGVGAILSDSDSSAIEPGRIHMAIGKLGYAGLVRCELGRINIAAALTPTALTDRKAISGVVQQTLRCAGIDLSCDLREAEWRSTRRLTTSSPCLSAQRLFLLGDSGGYVEPFTGEGMAAAIEDALAIVPLALQSVACWKGELAERWQHELSQRQRRRQRDCRRLAWLLRRPWAARWGMRLATAWPSLGEQIAERVGRTRLANLRDAA